MADVGNALHERQEKLKGIGERTEELNNSAANFLEAAKQLSQKQEQKSRSWKIW